MDKALGNLHRHAALIVTAVVAGLAVAAALTWLTPTTYRSSTKLFVTAAHPVDTAAAYEGNLFTQQRMTSYANILTSPQLAQRVVAELGLSLTPEALAGEVTATATPDTVVLDVTVTDGSARRAHDIADSLGRQFTSTVVSLEQPDGAASSAVSVRTIQAASYEPEPVGPDLTGNLWRGGAIGLLVGVLLALLLGRVDSRVRTEDDLVEAAGVRLLGRAEDDRQLAKLHVITALPPRARSVDGYRAMAAGLQQNERGVRQQVVLVTGCLPGDGASTVAVNLAVSIARMGARVLLVDADLRRPRAARYLGLPDRPGMTEVLTSEADLDQATIRYGDGLLWVLPSGGMHSNPGDLLGSAAMRALLEDVRDAYDFVVLDGPPVLARVDAALLGTHADTCLLVARYGRTHRADLAEAVDDLARVNAPVPGVVLNRAPRGRGLKQVGGRAYRPDDVRAAVATAPTATMSAGGRTA